MRKYKSGSRWAFWRWTHVPTDSIVRLHVVMTPWFAICVHWLKTPDPEPWLHDHPVSFLSIILHGWYVEFRDQPTMLPGRFARAYYPCWFNFIRATDKHKIFSVGHNTVTLCFMGPKVREWGYHTPGGWVHWKEYQRRTYNG